MLAKESPKILPWVIIVVVSIIGVGFIIYKGFLTNPVEFEKQFLVSSKAKLIEAINQDKIISTPEFNSLEISQTNLMEQNEAEAYSLMPQPPLGVEILDSEIGKTLVIFWLKPVSREVKYIRLYRSTSIGSLGSKIVDLEAESYKSYRDMNLVNGTKYYYTLRAVNEKGVESDNIDQFSGMPSDKTAPEAPENIFIESQEKGIKLSWEASGVSDFAGVNIYRSIELGKIGEIIASTKENQYTDQNISEGLTYYYTLTATDTSGNESTKELLELPAGRDNPFLPF